MCWLRAWLVPMLFLAVVAQHRIDQDSMLAARPARVRGDHLAKTDEPTCEQLKAMWRFSKRQARTPEILNEVSSYRDPLMYNEWPAYSAIPRTVPRFRYPAYPAGGGESYGRVVTKVPPNAVRNPAYPGYTAQEIGGILSGPDQRDKMLRFAGPSSRPRAPSTFMVPPQRYRFDDLKKMIRQERIRELQRQYETEHKQELKSLVESARNGDDYVYGSYGEQEPRGLQPLLQEYSDEPNGRHPKKPQASSRQVSQFSRYSDAILPPSRRSRAPHAPALAPPDLANPDLLPYAF